MEQAGWKASVAAIVTMALMLCGPSARAQLTEARAAFDKEDYAAAYRLYSPPAKQGVAEAQHRVGVMHKFGWGVERDHAVAAKWFLAAAEQGLADAQSELAIYYKDGRGVERDLKRSADWFLKASEQGVGIAQLNLGRYYLAGTGVEKNAEQAYYWLTRAGLSNYVDGFALRVPLVKELGADLAKEIEARAKQASPAKK
jgi:hypothetical protein